MQRPLHHLVKDMLECLRPLGTLAEQHSAEMEALEPRREPIWGSAASPAPEELLRMVLDGAPLLTCLRRLLLTIAMRGALPEPAFLECVHVLLGAFGAHHVLTLTALEAAGMPLPALRVSHRFCRVARTADPSLGRFLLTDSAPATVRGTSGLVCAGLFVRKTPQTSPKLSSSLAAVRMLFDKAEENQRGNRDSLQLASLLTDSDQAEKDPSTTGLPYGRYHPISMLLIRQALMPYSPSWMGVRRPTLLAASRSTPPCTRVP